MGIETGSETMIRATFAISAIPGTRVICATRATRPSTSGISLILLKGHTGSPGGMIIVRKWLGVGEEGMLVDDRDAGGMILEEEGGGGMMVASMRTGTIWGMVVEVEGEGGEGMADEDGRGGGGCEESLLESELGRRWSEGGYGGNRILERGVTDRFYSCGIETS